MGFFSATSLNIMAVESTPPPYDTMYFDLVFKETSSKKKNVSTTSSGKSFGIWINHNTSWLAPYTKLYTLSGGNYDGYTVYGVTSAYTQELTDWNFNGPQIFGYKSVGPIAGSTCGCTSISEGNYISALVVLQSVH